MATSSIPTSTLQVLLAPFKHLWLAVPMATVRKIMRLSDLLNEGEILPEMIEVDDLVAKVIDLYEQIYGVPNPQPDTHVVVLQIETGQEFALPVGKLPTIVNLEAATVKPIPTDYRNLYMLDIASHIALLKQGTKETTVFVLDPEKLSLLG